jgi:transposase
MGDSLLCDPVVHCSLQMAQQQNRNFSIGKRWRIVSMRMDGGFSTRQVADHFGISQRTVNRLLAKYSETGDVEDRPRSGRPRATVPAEDEFIVQRSRANPFAPATSIQEALLNSAGTEVTPQTVRNRLKENELRCYRPVRFPALSDHHKECRLQFACQHRNWSAAQWQRVVWTDESRFRVHTADGRVRV